MVLRRGNKVLALHQSPAASEIPSVGAADPPRRQIILLPRGFEKLARSFLRRRSAVDVSLLRSEAPFSRYIHSPMMHLHGLPIPIVR